LFFSFFFLFFLFLFFFFFCVIFSTVFRFRWYSILLVAVLSLQLWGDVLFFVLFPSCNPLPVLTLSSCKRKISWFDSVVYRPVPSNLVPCPRIDMHGRILCVWSVSLSISFFFSHFTSYQFGSSPFYAIIIFFFHSHLLILPFLFLAFSPPFPRVVL